MTRSRNVLLGLLSTMLMMAGPVEGQVTQRSAVVSSGGSAASNTQFLNMGTVGQSLVGSSANAEFSNSSGFWPQASETVIQVEYLSAPQLLMPQDGEEAVALPVVLTWAPVDGAETYRVLVATDIEFGAISVDTSGIPFPELVLTDLSEGALYFWRVAAANSMLNGPFSPSFSFTTAVASAVNSDVLPRRFGLEQNYPNPFNPDLVGTTIAYALPRPEHVRLTVFDLFGRQVEVLVDDSQTAGWHAARFESRDAASGVYIYRLEAGEFEAHRTMLLIK